METIESPSDRAKEIASRIVSIGPDPQEAIQPCGHMYVFTVTLTHYKSGESAAVCLKCLEEMLKESKAKKDKMSHMTTRIGG